MQHILKNIPLPQTSKRIDCPGCGGKNTLSISNLGLITLFYCFKASCNVKGKVQNDIGVDSLKVVFKDPEKTKEDLFNLNSFLFIPDLNYSSRIKKYLCDNGCWEAYREGRADIRYDPYEDRVVFIIYATEGTIEPVSAIGRQLIPSLIAPKWRQYGNLSKPFICAKNTEQQSQILVIVEDCCSACAASSYYDSAALLGTNLKDTYIKDFLTYDKFIIALDKDASKAAFIMQKYLQFYKPTSILLLEEDLKRLSFEEIGVLFNA